MSLRNHNRREVLETIADFISLDYLKDQYDSQLGLLKSDYKRWDPINRDGDCFRLQQRFRVCIEFTDCEDDSPVIYVGFSSERRDWKMVSTAGDSSQITRETIVMYIYNYILKVREALDYLGNK